MGLRLIPVLFAVDWKWVAKMFPAVEGENMSRTLLLLLLCVEGGSALAQDYDKFNAPPTYIYQPQVPRLGTTVYDPNVVQVVPSAPPPPVATTTPPNYGQPTNWGTANAVSMPHGR